MSSQPLARPGRFEEATPAQHGLIIKLVCKSIGEDWWRSPDMTKVATYINSTFNKNLDAELEPLTRREASEIISQLTA